MKGDGLYKRPKTPYWYFKRNENGRWREVSTKTVNYQQAKRVRRKSLQDQEEGRLPDGEMARWPFERATRQYLKVAAIRLRLTTLRKEGFFLVRPIELFGSLACEKITATHMQELQTAMKRKVS